MSFNRECNGHTIFILALRHYFQTIVTNRKAIVMKKLAFRKYQMTVVGLMLSGTCVMAANSITTAPTNGIGGATQTIPVNPGLPPATPEESTGRAFGTLS